MPEIQKVFHLSISPERFLDACSPTELQEIDLLIQAPRYRNQMKMEEFLDQAIKDHTEPALEKPT